MSRIIAPDLAGLTPGWWWLRVSPPGAAATWVQGRLLLPDTGPCLLTIDTSGHSRRHAIVETAAGLDIDLRDGIAHILAASPAMHPDEEGLLRRQIANAIRTVEAHGTILGLLIHTDIAAMGLDSESPAAPRGAD